MTPSEAPPRSGLDDPRVRLAVEEYLAALDAGRKPDRREFLAGHADITEALEKCLDGLDFVHSAAPRLHSPGQQPSSPNGELQPEGPLGDFRIVREVGRGGMGVVYEAVQISMGRRVALKVLPFAAVTDPRHLQRFKNEARAAGSLQHPHIVPVYFVGSERGVHYFAMQFVEGQTLAALIRQLRPSAASEERTTASPPPGGAGDPEAATEPAARQSTLASGASPKRRDYFRRVAEWGEQAAEALDHAHQTGIVHRDVKPGNLMIDSRGHLWVTDFGLARVRQGEASLTMTGDLVGTLRYMSPEQALAKRVLIDHRTDVYSLGVTLYELLTLEPAFAGADRQEVLRQIAFEEPRAPGRVNRSVPAELETIVLKAMEKNPADRYATAKELADDLRRFLEDRPIRARRPSWRQAARKWARRHQPAVWSAAVVFLVTALVGGSTWLWWAQKRAGAEVAARAALDEAARLGRQERWAEAQSATRRAREVLAGVGADPDLRREVEDLDKDLEMARRLQEASLQLAVVKDGQIDWAAADGAYADAFRWYGLDVEHLDPGEAAERIRSRSIRTQLVAALDDWATGRRNGGRNWRPIMALSRTADSDPWRNRLRDAWERENPGAVEKLLASVPGDGLPSGMAVFLARITRGAVEADRTGDFLVQSRLRHPGDFWVNHELGVHYLRREPPRLEEAVRYLSVAVALRPECPGARISLGNAQRARGQLDEAIREYRQAVQLDPRYARAYHNLGVALHDKGQLNEALREYRRAIQLDPKFTPAHYHLGNALRGKGQADEAVAAYRAALALDPRFAMARNNLGVALYDKGRLDEAIRVFLQAIQLDPKDARAHHNLGLALYDKGRPDEAIREYRQAVQLDPRYARAHHNLGVALCARGQLDEAVREYRQAIQLDPKDALAHYHLGNARRAQGQLDEAITAYRAAVALDPKFAWARDNLGIALLNKGQLDEALREWRAAVDLNPDAAEAHCNLGNLLVREKGQFAEGLALLRRGHELGSKRPDWRLPSAQWVRQAERMVALAEKLPAILEGEAQPANADERLLLARMCYHRAWHAAAARYWSDAFAADPKLTGDLNAQHRYNAACAAALAGCGQGEDADHLDMQERAGLRRQALGWLRADLRVYRHLLVKSADKAGPAVGRRLRHWLQDPDFTGVRGTAALGRLSEAERGDWQKLWEEVEALRQRAAQPTGPTSAAPP
jgi:tetratricopeptide (TPR) repeat protein